MYRGYLLFFVIVLNNDICLWTVCGRWAVCGLSLVTTNCLLIEQTYNTMVKGNTSIQSQSQARIKILADIKAKEKAVYSKKKQITSARGKTKFSGVRIQDQFSVGRLGVKPFRARRKSERKQGLVDLGIFRGELPTLKANLKSSRKSLTDFDSMPFVGL